jgi:hypothetical protein
VPMSLLRYSGFWVIITSKCYICPAHNKYFPGHWSLFLRCASNKREVLDGPGWR